MKILGIDASLSATGLCVLDTSSFNNKSFFTETLINELRGVERILYIEKKIIEYAQDVELVVMENYAFDAKYSREVLGELQGVIKRRLYLMNKPLLLVDTYKLKKIQAGSSHNPTKLNVKKWIMQEVYKRYNIDFNGKDNECDAFGLALIGLCKMGVIEELYISDIVKEDLINVIQHINNTKPKIKKNLSYYFNLPYNIIVEYREHFYILSIDYFNISIKCDSLKKGLVLLEKEKRQYIRTLRKNKKRIVVNKKIKNRLSYRVKKN